MEFRLDPCNNNYKHFCKKCNKGFMCGRALGGHMRAHGIDDHADVYDEKSDCEAGGDNSEGNKWMYALRTNPHRSRNRECDNCGKEFLSWKSFLQHGRCSGGGESKDNNDEDSPAASSPISKNGDRWSKRKCPFRCEGDNNFTINDYNLANSLMMLSNAVVDTAALTIAVVDQQEESSSSAERHLINFTPAPLASLAPPPTIGLFECKACKKVFNSHQALGGHRASHKKVKGCFAARLDPVDSKQASNFFDERIGLNSPKRNKGSKVHECSICHRVFNSGQALGGHKRCHWITPASSSAAITMDPTVARFQQLHDSQVKQQGQAGLDLNILRSQIDPDPKNILSLRVSTEFFLRYEEINKENLKNVIGSRKTKNNEDTNYRSFETLQANNVDDEADSIMKMAKLSELKGNVAGCSAAWLQVGIGSTDGGDL